MFLILYVNHSKSFIVIHRKVELMTPAKCTGKDSVINRNIPYKLSVTLFTNVLLFRYATDT